ncbi:hypothetical protein VitviT2T_022932 [Vitis vinifera]|uniref:DDE Tnp4 domain-containing protein n=1 Tax=Vitis vinifera TaxID=29760 RepID=A0ABY9DBB6_VITVI|nr:hypothetical protein VitviT2T_022932 [Vitis vinifera]
MVENKMGLKVKRLKSDNGGEYKDEKLKEFCATNGIKLEKIVLKTPQQNDIIKPSDPQFKEVPDKIRNDDRYWPYFKNCIGVIDGTHIPVVVPRDRKIPYIGRKGVTTQNVMAVCDFNMCFTFAWAGWEGVAHDARVFLEALRRPELGFPHPPKGKYYLVDAGYPQMSGYLGPYKGERYHLPDFRRGSSPKGPVFCHGFSVYMLAEDAAMASISKDGYDKDQSS